MIIFEGDDNSDPTPAKPVAHPDQSGRDLLLACATEAVRHADQLSGLDAALGAALIAGADKDRGAGQGLDPVLLQQVDLLRQEAAGLACLLKLLSEQEAETAMVDGTRVSACLPTAQQRSRLVGL